jgi:hypothetical protein
MPLQKMGRFDKMVVLTVLIIAVILVCVSLEASWQKLRQSTLLEGIYGLIHILYQWEEYSKVRNKVLIFDTPKHYFILIFRNTIKKFFSLIFIKLYNT